MCAPLAFTPCAVIEYGLLALFLKVTTICSPTSALMMGPVAGKTNTSAQLLENKQTNKQTRFKSNCTQNSQVLLAILPHGEGVVGVFPIHHLLVAGADPVFSSLHKCAARAGRPTPIKIHHQTTANGARL